MESRVEMMKKMEAQQRDLQSVRARMEMAKQNKRMATLTSDQISKEQTNGVVWQAAGRMFMKVSEDEYKKSLEAKQKQLDEQLSALSKKETYHRTTLEKMLLATEAK